MPTERYGYSLCDHDLTSLYPISFFDSRVHMTNNLGIVHSLSVHVFNASRFKVGFFRDLISCSLILTMRNRKQLLIHSRVWPYLCWVSHLGNNIQYLKLSRSLRFAFYLLSYPSICRCLSRRGYHISLAQTVCVVFIHLRCSVFTTCVEH